MVAAGPVHFTGKPAPMPGLAGADMVACGTLTLAWAAAVFGAAALGAAVLGAGGAATVCARASFSSASLPARM